MPAESGSLTSDQLAALLESLPPWADRDFSEAEWRRYSAAAEVFMRATPATVETALSAFMQRTPPEGYPGYEHESKPFLLMRVLFELPESAPAAERRSFKGWTNWPEPDSQGRVSLSWPVSWPLGRPQLVATYAGSLGVPYDAVEEYRWFGERYPFRQAGEVRRP